MNTRNRRFLLIITGLLAFLSAAAQSDSSRKEYIEKRYTFFFPVGRSEFVEDYKGNGHTLQTMISDLNATLESEGTVPDSLTIFASTSPEGPAALNERLAIERANNTKEILVKSFPQFKAENIKVSSQAIDWSGMVLTLRRDTSFAYGQIILKLLTDPTVENKDVAIRSRLPQAYDALKKAMFDNMRTASVTISVIRTLDNVDEYVIEPEFSITSPSPVDFTAEGGEGTVTFEKNVKDEVVPVVKCNAGWVENIKATPSEITYEVVENPRVETRSAVMEVECYGKTHQITINQAAAAPVLDKPSLIESPAEDVNQTDEIMELKPFYIAAKTNMLYDLGIVPNVGLEFYLGKNFSVAGNWMYSWWKSDKVAWYWRTYGGDLAVRYWFGKAAQEKPLTGHHVGLYGQIVTYDFEVGGRGYLGDRWSYGAGAEYGYSLPVKPRLNIDFNIGVGYLGGEYKEYLPIDGHYVWQVTKRRHWFGPTKAEISLTWLLGRGNENKGKGGKR